MRKSKEWENFCGGSKKVFCSFLSFDKLTYSINIDGVSRCPLYGNNIRAYKDISIHIYESLWHGDSIL